MHTIPPVNCKEKKLANNDLILQQLHKICDNDSLMLEQISSEPRIRKVLLINSFSMLKNKATC